MIPQGPGGVASAIYQSVLSRKVPLEYKSNQYQIGIYAVVV